MTDKLIGFDSLDVIDPCVEVDLTEKYRQLKNVSIHKGLSLEVLPSLVEPYDCFLIDGDHNWFTVYNELKLIHEKGLLNQGGTIFLHDVCFPYGRRDMYYQPERIPAAFLQPHAKKGMIEGRRELVEGGQNGEYFNALFEGGARNGVLTAIEDFIKEHGGYLFCYLREEYGLGVMYSGTEGSPEFKRLSRLADQLRLKSYARRAVKSVPGGYSLLKMVRRLLS